MSDQPHIIRGGPVRARDLRSNIKEMGFEQGVVHTLERLMDEFTSTRQDLRALTGLVDSCINQMNNFLKLGEGMRQRIDEIQRVQRDGDVIDHEPH